VIRRLTAPPDLARLRRMARPLRVEYADAVYHVMSRGIEGRRICADNVDRDMWLRILGRAAERFGWRVHAFSLLDNHFHLFLRTPEAGLSAGMRQLNGDYAGYFNRRHGRLGPLMQGRYKSVLVDVTAARRAAPAGGSWKRGWAASSTTR